jgi:CRP/FNR family transcriptional regulator, anaerobic regulatory protein
MAISGWKTGQRGGSACETCAIRHRGICGVLSSEQLDRLGAIGRRRTLVTDEYIFNDGEETISFATIVSGVVKLIKVTSEGERHVMGLMYAPEFLGYTFGGQHRFSAAAATEVELCVFPRKPFRRLLLEFPGLERWLFEFTSRELEVCRDWTLMLSRKSSYERVASLLLIIARRARHSGCAPLIDNYAQFVLPLTRSEIADYLGLSLETVSRNMAKLKRKNLIELPGKRDVIVPDLELLSAIANMDTCGDESADNRLLEHMPVIES